MNLLSIHSSLVLTALFTFLLSAQGSSPNPLSAISDSGGGATPGWWAISVLPPEAELAPIGQTDSTSTNDSLELKMIELDIEAAEEEVNTTSFWWRILPQVRVSASFGMGNLLFLDFSSMTPFVVPKDDYRLTFSLSLNSILDFARHSQAVERWGKLRTEYQRRMLAIARNRESLQLQLNAVLEELQSLTTELSVLRELVRFNELRFEQGKIEYDVLARSKLEVISLQTNLNRLKVQKSQLLLKLY